MERYLSDIDDGIVVEADPGDAIVVRLDENPTTGYRWVLEEAEGEAVSLQDDDFVRSADAGVGAGGRRAFTFAATEPGTARIVLKLGRRWEGDASVVDRFRMTVQVGATGDP